MINIIDTFRNVIGDKYAVIKLAILSIPVVMYVYAYIGSQLAFARTIDIVSDVLLSAVFFETIRRSCASEPMLMPSFINPIRMFITLALTIVASIPALIICGLLGFGYFEILKSFTNIQQDNILCIIVTGIFVLLISSIFFASVTQFLDSGSIINSYNPIKVIKSLHTFIINHIFFAIQNVIFFCIVALIPLSTIYIISGFRMDNIVFYSYLSFYSVLNIIMWADFIAQTKKEADCD